MGASLVLRDSATPLKGRGLTVLLWVRRDFNPAEGEMLTYQSSCAAFTHVTAELLPKSSGVHSVQKFGCTDYKLFNHTKITAQLNYIY